MIHELFHSLCLDMAELNLTKKLKNQLGKIFNVEESNYDIVETYCELWANIINAMFLSYEITYDFDDFLSKMNYLIQLKNIFLFFKPLKF